MDLQEFLVWLTTSGGYAAALSFIAERWLWFQSLTPQQKSLFHLAGSLVIVLVAYAVLTYVPADALEAVKPVFLLVSTVIGAWMANQFTHGADPAAKVMADTP
jgi:uncharacterized membrane protein